MSGLMREWVTDPGAFDLAKSASKFVDSIVAGIVTAPPRLERAAERMSPGVRATTAA
jgi:hypothetical protein